MLRYLVFQFRILAAEIFTLKTKGCLAGFYEKKPAEISGILIP